MHLIPLQDTVEYLRAELDTPVVYSFLGGQLTVFTTPAPDHHGVNEDAIAVVPLDEDNAVLLLADGLGGLPNGDQAAAIALGTIVDALLQGREENLSLRECILNGIEHANEKIQKTGSGFATTLAVIEIQGHTIRPYHIGDPFILLSGQRGKVKFQNVTHSPMGYAVEAGVLDQDEAVHHEERNIVSNVLGMADMRIEIGPTLRLTARDTLLVSSDGLPDNLYVDEIVETIRAGRMDRIAEHLVHHAHERMRNPIPNLPSHSDDLSFILYRPLR